jgi:hypothetical protein
VSGQTTRYPAIRLWVSTAPEVTELTTTNRLLRCTGGDRNSLPIFTDLVLTLAYEPGQCRCPGDDGHAASPDALRGVEYIVEHGFAPANITWQVDR